MLVNRPQNRVRRYSAADAYNLMNALNSGVDIAKKYGPGIVKTLKNAYKGKPQGPFGTKLPLKRKTVDTQGGSKKVVIKKQKVSSRRIKGYYKGVFRKGRSKKQLNIKMTNGTQKKIESGGVYSVNTSDCLYIGHAVAKIQVFHSIARALFKILFNKAQSPIKDWTEKAGGGLVDNGGYWINGRFAIIRTELIPATVYNGVPALVAFDTFLDGTLTWDQLAKNWYTAFLAATDPDKPAYVKRVILQEVTGSTPPFTAANDPRAQLNGSDIKLHFEIYSNLKIQNRTLGQAVSGVVGDPDADVDINIANNPLVGKVYTSNKKWMNGFIPEYPKTGLYPTSGGVSPQYVGGPYAMLADTEYGYIKGSNFRWNSVGGLSAVTGAKGNLSKPPGGHVFGVTKTHNCTLHPGEIKTSSLKFKTKINLNNFLIKYWLSIADNAALTVDTQSYPVQKQFSFGFSEMVGLEKMLDSRDESEIDISVSWEINQTYTCYATYSSDKRSLTLVDINTVPQ